MMNALIVCEKVFIGTCHVGLSLGYTVQGVKYCLPEEVSVQRELGFIEGSEDRVINGIAAVINASGAIARCVDWVVAEKWMVIGAVQVVALKMLAHITGVFYHFKNALNHLDAIFLIEMLEKDEIYKSSLTLESIDFLAVRKLGEISSLVSNIAIALHSGVSLSSIAFQVVIFSPPVLNLLLTIGFVSLVAAAIFRFSSTPAENLLNVFRAEHDKRFGFVY